MLRNRRGNVGIILLGLILTFVLVYNSFYILERKSLIMKRHDIQNAVVAANLAAYDSIVLGKKTDVLSIRPDLLQNYIANPSSIPKESVEKVINMMNSEYFPKGERYKSLYLNKDKAYSTFSNYLEENLDLTKSQTNSKIFHSNDKSNGIDKVTINEFVVTNAISNWDIDKTLIQGENRKYTGIHIDLDATVLNMIKIEPFTGTSNVPIHIDTELTLFRPKI